MSMEEELTSLKARIWPELFFTHSREASEFESCPHQNLDFAWISLVAQSFMR